MVQFAVDTPELKNAFVCGHLDGDGSHVSKMKNFSSLLKRLILNAIKILRNHLMEGSLSRNLLYHCLFSLGHWHITFAIRIYLSPFLY